MVAKTLFILLLLHMCGQHYLHGLCTDDVVYMGFKNQVSGFHLLFRIYSHISTQHIISEV